MLQQNLSKCVNGRVPNAQMMTYIIPKNNLLDSDNLKTRYCFNRIITIKTIITVFSDIVPVTVIVELSIVNITFSKICNCEKVTKEGMREETLKKTHDNQKYCLG